MNDNKVYLTHAEENGAIHVSEEVVAAIAGNTALEIEGVAALMNSKGAVRGVRLTAKEEQLVLDLYVMVKFGCAVQEVAKKVQQAVSVAVTDTTGFTVTAVNVHVGGISLD